MFWFWEVTSMSIHSLDVSVIPTSQSNRSKILFSIWRKSDFSLVEDHVLLFRVSHDLMQQFCSAVFPAHQIRPRDSFDRKDLSFQVHLLGVAIVFLSEHVVDIWCFFSLYKHLTSGVAYKDWCWKWALKCRVALTVWPQKKC